MQVHYQFYTQILLGVLTILSAHTHTNTNVANLKSLSFIFELCGINATQKYHQTHTITHNSQLKSFHKPNDAVYIFNYN